MSVFEISIPNIDKVMGQVEAYAKELENKIHKFMEELGKIGIDKAFRGFSSAEYDGENDVEISQNPEWIDENTLAVKASGTSILFIEFGTGVYNPITHPLASEFGYERGEYGLGNGNFESWFYQDKRQTSTLTAQGERIGDGTTVMTRGNNANRCMWYAAEDMRNAVYKKAKEVFYS